MKKTLIIPYFGKFPDTFSIWLESCKNNPSINWLIVTDIPINEELPCNVKKVKMSFDELRAYFQKKFDFKISLPTPYKLCDFRAAYGFLFEEYLSDSDFWGYCDMDTIWGNISKFLTEDIFNSYDKIMKLGHLCFVKNKKEINENFLNYNDYRLVFSTPANYAFDEIGLWGGYHYGFNSELTKSGYKVYTDCSHVSDVNFYKKNFFTQSEKPCLFLYEKGTLWELHNDSKEEVMYVHFQKRKITVSVDQYCGTYFFVPDVVYSGESILKNEDVWSDFSDGQNNTYIEQSIKKTKRNNDLKRLFYEPRKVKSLYGWLKCVLSEKNRNPN